MPFNTLTSRNPNGVTNSAPWQTMANSGREDPTWSHLFRDDFDFFVASQWAATVTGTGTQALATGYDGGGLLLTNTAGATDSIYMQLLQASFVAIPGKDTFFKWAGQLSDVITNTFYSGLIMQSATPLTAANGIFISKPAGAATLQLNLVIGGVTTVVPFPAVCLVAANIYFEVGIHVDSQGSVEAFFNPTTGNNPINAGAGAPRGRVAGLVFPNNIALTQVALSPSFGLLNGSAAARTMTTDFIVTSRSR